MINNSNIISVIGAGAWGTAIAKLASSQAKNVYLITKDKDLVKIINSKMYNSRSLPDVNLPTNIVSTSYMDVCEQSEVIFIASDFLQLSNIGKKLSVVKLKENTKLVLLCKGIQKEDLKLPSQTLAEYLPNNDIFVLSGPNYAKEVANNLPTISTLAGPSEGEKIISESLTTYDFKLEYTDDIIGVQLCGALKNVLAIGCGIIDGLNSSYNNKAVLFYKGVQEIKQIMKVFNAKEETIFLSCGLGDLFLTCSNMNSRNYAYGRNLIYKNNNEVEDLVEGLNSAGAVFNIINKYNLNLPILSNIAKVAERMLEPEILADLSNLE